MNIRGLSGRMVALFFLLAIPTMSQDIIKLKVLDQALKCHILETSDSLVVFQKYNSDQILRAAIPDIEWYIYENDSTVNYSGKEIKQSEIDNAFEYQPPPKSNALDEEEYDYLKLKAFPLAIVCSIIGTTDTLITYRQINSDRMLKARPADLDWYQLHTGIGYKYSKKTFTQADFISAYIYEPAARGNDQSVPDTTFVSNDTLPFFRAPSENVKDYSPLEINILSNPKKVYTIAAEQLLRAGFLIVNSNSDLFSLTTDYTNYDPSFFKGLFSSMLGVENIKSAISLMVIPINSDSSKLVIRGKVRFTKGSSILEKALVGRTDSHDKEDITDWIIRRNTDMIKPIEAIAVKIKETSEGIDH